MRIDFPFDDKFVVDEHLERWSTLRSQMIRFIRERFRHMNRAIRTLEEYL